MLAQDFYAGATGGLVLSQVDGDSFGGYNKFGGNAGLFVRNSFGEKWGGRMELKYIQKGSVATKLSNPLSAYGYYKMNLHYVEIPFLMEYNFQHLKIPPKIDWNFDNRLKLLAGLHLSYLFKATEDEGPGPNDATNTFTKIEIGAQLGITWFIGDHLAFDYRFSYTLLPIRFSPNTTYYYWVNWEFNRVMTFSIMYQF
jgi:hypothetical protein